MEYLKGIFELVFPTKSLCYFCRSRDLKLEGYICVSCREKLNIVHREVLLDSAKLERCFYSTVYDRFMKDMVKRFKFNDSSYLYKPLGAILCSTMVEKNIRDQVDYVAFIPSHRRKEALRGYNQSELLAGFISKEFDLPLFKGLVKVRPTKDQHFLSEGGRRTNLNEAFKVRGAQEIKDKRILLVDDILTSGYTMEEVAGCLMENKARGVIGLALTSSRKL